jgi:hypothetical protein
VGGWMDGWVGVKAVLRIAYSNQKSIFKEKTKLIDVKTRQGQFKFTFNLYIFHCKVQYT